MILEDLESDLAQLERQHLRRRSRVIGSPCLPQAIVDGERRLAFCSNDYLGLANHPELIEALCAGARRWGAGSGASHLVSGHLAPHEELQRRLAEFVGAPRALTFAAGYLANIGIVPALIGRGGAIFADRLNHASLIDAAVLSRATHRRYAHNDHAALERLLAASDARRKLILTDAVFSMDGDLAPLPRLFDLAERHDAWLVIDDAHGFGVLGEGGRGSLAHFGLKPSARVVYIGTFGKAAGVAGAFAAGDDKVMEWLLERARSHVFSTAPPPALSCALLKSLELIAAADDRRAHLRRLIAMLRSGLADIAQRRGFTLADSQTAVQPLIVGANEAALELAAALERRGLWVPAIRPPTVPEGTARLRISLSAAHTEDDVAQLLAALNA